MKKPPGILLPILGILGGTSIIVALAILIAVNRSRADLDAYKAELEQRGETFEVTRLTPPAPPTENNGAAALVAAGETLRAAVTKNSLKPFQTGQPEASPGQAAVLHQLPAARRFKKDVPWEDFRREMEPLRPLLGEIRRSAKAPNLEIQPDYTLGFSMPLPFLTPFLSSGQFLGAESLLLLRDGDTATAAENIESMLRIAAVANRQPILISRLVAVSLAGISQTTTWEFLQANPTPEELQRVQKAWQSFSLIDGIPAILRMERASGIPAFSSELDKLKTIAALSSPPLASPSSSLDEHIHTVEWTIWSVIFRHADERNYIAYHQGMLDRLDRGEDWRQVFAWARSLEIPLSVTNLSRKLSAMSIPTINNALGKSVGQAALQSLTITATALRRYQRNHAGQPPETLADLVPAYLSAIPKDPMDGLSVRYQRQGEHFLLYSIGENGVDDGGNTAAPHGKTRRSPIDGLDIVWPQAIPSVTPAPAGNGPDTPRE